MSSGRGWPSPGKQKNVYRLKSNEFYSISQNKGYTSSAITLHNQNLQKQYEIQANKHHKTVTIS